MEDEYRPHRAADGGAVPGGASHHKKLQKMKERSKGVIKEQMHADERTIAAMRVFFLVLVITLVLFYMVAVKAKRTTCGKKMESDFHQKIRITSYGALIGVAIGAVAGLSTIGIINMNRRSEELTQQLHQKEASKSSSSSSSNES